MYIGKFLHLIDSKNRVFLPVKFRQKSKKFFIVQGLESCLYLYDLPRWQSVIDKLGNLGLSDKSQERAFKRALLSNAHEISPDSQGRILIPQDHKDYAKLLSEIIFIGVGNRLEVWSKENWDRYHDEHLRGALQNLAGKLEI